MNAKPESHDPSAQSVPGDEPPPPYQPDLSLVTELERGLDSDAPDVEQR